MNANVHRVVGSLPISKSAKHTSEKKTMAKTDCAIASLFGDEALENVLLFPADATFGSTRIGRKG